jgi:hypothetical protein
MYVCMYACLYIGMSMHACMCNLTAHIHAHAKTTHLKKKMSTETSAATCVCVCVYSMHLGVIISTHSHTSHYARSDVCRRCFVFKAFLHVYQSMCVYVYVCVCVCVCVLEFQCHGESTQNQKNTQIFAKKAPS